MGLYFIGNGQPAMVDDFVAQLGLAAPVWVDPTRASYRALGLRRSPFAVLNPAALGNLGRAAIKGFRQGRTQGDPWQQGGVLVVRRGGAPVYSYASAVAGDHPPIAVVLEHARLAAAP